MFRRRNPWHGPWLLRAFTWAYLAWFFIPLALAIRISFTAEPLTTGVPAGWSLQHYRAVLVSPDSLVLLGRSFRLAVATVVIAVPMGAAAGVALGRWSGRSTWSLTALLLLAIAIPQTLLATNLFFFAVTMRFRVGPMAQLIGHITVALPFVVLLVLLRVRTIHPEQEESAADLGANPFETVRRALLPQLAPALAAAASVAFVISFDNFVMSQWLCIQTATCDTLPMSLFGRGAVANPAAGSYALATMGLIVSLSVMGIGALSWGKFRRTW